jgi:hypothetical protein
MKPQRIQRKRSKGWRMPENTVSVCRPGKWGNPHKVTSTLNAHEAVEAFKADLEAGRLGFTIDEVRRDLHGKNLACWCKKGDPCHVDILLHFANLKTPETI